MSSINVDTIKSRLGGPPTLSKGVVVSAAATFSSDVSIAGTITYEDVTNVDVVGVITARSGIEFGVAGVGGTIRANGDTTLVGVVTATSFVGDGSSLTGLANTDFVNATQLTVIGVTTAIGGVEFGAAGVGGTIRANGDTTLVGVVTASEFVGGGSGLTGLNIPAGFTELDAALFN